jgi:hypothetical protein
VFTSTFSLFARLISHQPAVLFLSEQTSHQQSAQISTSHQPPAKRTGCLWTIATKEIIFT